MLDNNDLEAIANLLNTTLKSELQPIHSKLDNLENRMSNVELEITALKGNQIAMRKELRQVSDKVTETYDLTLENWGDIVESKSRLELLEK